jgi:hypothetical protein
VPQGFDRVHQRGAARRVESEDDADRHRYPERHEDRPRRDDRLQIVNSGRKRCPYVGKPGPEAAPQAGRHGMAQKPGRHADQTAGGREDDGLGQELLYDVAPFCPERAAYADLARPLGDRRQHDIHYADAADDERDAGDDDEEHVEHGAQHVGLAQELLGHRDGIVPIGMLTLEQNIDDVGSLLDLFALADRDGDLAVLYELPLAAARSRREHLVADARAQRFEGYVDVQVVVAAFQAAADSYPKTT